MNTTIRQRIATITSLRGAETKSLRILSISGGLMLASSGLYAAAEPEEAYDALPETTIIANRVETDLDKVGSSVTILDAIELDQQGIRQMDDALKFVPGVISDTSSGQRGTSSSVFIRGNNSDYTGVIVDGFRMDGSGGFRSKSFYGTANILGLSKIEVLKGPQSVLYGASSASGVIGLSQAKGEGEFGGAVRLEAGSFDSYNSSLASQGRSGKFSYSLSLSNEQTDNDLPNNEFESNSYALRLDYDVSDSLQVGLTTRGAQSELNTPDYDAAGLTYPFKSRIDFDNNLTTLFAEYDINDVWSSKLTLGYYDETYRSDDIALSLFETEANKFAAYWDNTLVWNSQHATVTGVSYERSQYESLIIDEITREQTGLYVNHVWDITDQLNVSGGLRWTDFSDDSSEGVNDDETTWRLASSYRTDSTNTIFRASVGTGFQLPAFNQVYSNTSPNQLDPTETIGWDIGIEQRFNEDRYVIGVTYFQTRIDSAINYVSGFGTATVYENTSGMTETSGIEAFASALLWDDRITTSLSYTWLDRQSLSGSRDPFLAEHTGSLRVDYKVTDKWNVGATSTYQGRRKLTNTSGGIIQDDYALLNLYTNYRISEYVSLHARVDNLLDKDYNYGSRSASGSRPDGEVRPGRGVGYFAGVTVSF